MERNQRCVVYAKSKQTSISKAKDQSSIKRWRRIQTNQKMKRMKVKRSVTKRFSKKVR